LFSLGFPVQPVAIKSYYPFSAVNRDTLFAPTWHNIIWFFAMPFTTWELTILPLMVWKTSSYGCCVHFFFFCLVHQGRRNTRRICYASATLNSKGDWRNTNAVLQKAKGYFPFQHFLFLSSF
jgi:hypothetical protein